MYKPIITKYAMVFKFRRPIYGSFFSIYDKWLKLAKRNHLKIVTKSEFGTSTYTPEEWLKGAKKIKKPHNFPDNPMVMFGRHLLKDIEKRNDRKEKEAKNKEPEISREDYLKSQDVKRLAIKGALHL